ncbi:MAG: hypothetical protein WKF34_08785 [Pyrinomonadaceae bacterium]
MNLKTKLYIAAAAVFAVVLIGGAAWSHREVGKLEIKVARAKTDAERQALDARAREIEAASYREKIAYLEAKLTDIQQLARKQDEELEKLNSNTHRARGDVNRARRTRSVAVTANELCQKLAELGHGCE